MRLPFAAPLVLSALFAVSARADSTYSFVLTDLTTGTDTVSFQLSPSTPYTPNEGSFLYESYPGVVGTTPATLDDLEFSTLNGSQELFVISANLYINTNFANPQFLTGLADGTPPTIAEGTYMGSVPCITTLRSPFVNGSSMPGTLAFVQMQAPIAFQCGDSVDLTITGPGVTPPSSVTPEPSSLALLGTGVLGVAGVMRRRMRA